MGGHRRRDGRNRVATAVASAACRTANGRRERILSERSQDVASVARDEPGSWVEEEVIGKRVGGASLVKWYAL